ncbi:MAG: ABC transporter permease [Propionibacteriaceae bacterium]
MTPRMRAVVAPLIFAVVIVVLWQWCSIDAPAFLIPSPIDVVHTLGRLLTSASFWPYVTETAIAALGGSVLGIVIALPLGLWLHRSVWASAAIGPYLGATQAIPAVALAPLLVLWVGYGLAGVVTLCAVMVFFPIVIATLVGLRHIDGGVISAAMLDGAGSYRRLVDIELPLAMPYILAGIRNGVTLAVTGAVVGEMVMGGHGLGTLLTVQRDSVDTAGMVSTIIVLCTLAMTAHMAVRCVEYRSLNRSGLVINDRKD